MPKNSMIPRYVGRLAVATSVLTWFLILVGGIVHGTGSSLACPDWPTCFGTFFPEMKGGIFFEHSHRLFASMIGLLTLLVMILLLKKGDAKLKLAGVIGFFLVVFQGVLGGITVLLRLPAIISIAHLATSFFFLLWMVRVSFLTLRENVPQNSEPASSVKKLLLFTLFMAYFQSILGAIVRHLGAGLACMDIPFCEGMLWPADGFSSMKLHMLHRIFGVVTALAVFLTSVLLYKRTVQNSVKFLLLLAPGLVMAQILLGVLSVITALGLFPVTAHLGVAALLLVDLWLIYLMDESYSLKNERGVLSNLSFTPVQETK